MIGCLVATSCSLIGSFLVLRNTSMISDAISHAVLPGIVIGYLISGSLSSPLLLLGAGITGILATLLIQVLDKMIGLQNDAAIGVTLTFLFAVGVILISLFTADSDLDMDCVLYGEILNTPFDKPETNTFLDLAPTSFYQQIIILLIIISFIIIFYKELKITSFDPAYASSIGIKTKFIHYGLMSLVSFITVAAFEAVGAILVICFMITPAATAFLVSKRLIHMIGMSIFFGIASIIIGYYLSAAISDTSLSATMAVVSGLLFCITVSINLLVKKSIKLK